jgi:hypothetical protein
VEPIFLETLNGNFEISVKNIFKFNLGGSPDGFDTPFSGLVLRGCNEDNPNVKLFLQKLQAKIILKLKAYPFSASSYRDMTTPDNELWLIRKNISSNLLDALYIEDSQYFITWNFVEDSHGKIIGLKFFLRQELLIEIGKGNGYVEPKPSQKEKYRQRLNTMVNECIHEVCLELKLQYDLVNFCKCN